MGVGNIEVIGQNATLADFIKESLENRRGSYRRVIIGVVSPEAQKRIDEVCHTQVFNINIDNSGVVHAVTKRQHNLEPGDLLHAVDVMWVLGVGIWWYLMRGGKKRFGGTLLLNGQAQTPKTSLRTPFINYRTSQ